MQMQANLERKERILALIEQLHLQDEDDSARLHQRYLPDTDILFSCCRQAALEDTLKHELSELMASQTFEGMRSHDFMKCINDKFFHCLLAPSNLVEEKQIAVWRFYSIVNQYANGCVNNKEVVLKQISKILIKHKTSSNPLEPALGKKEIKFVYLSGDRALIDLFMLHFPIPPTTLFDAAERPAILLEREAKKSICTIEFSRRNASTHDLEKKIIYIQRHLRGKIRRESELDRIGRLFFKHSEIPAAAANTAIEDANTAYRPQLCSAELADRIRDLASELVLFSSVKHLASAEHIAGILDGCLYGRINLINSCIDFRPAALGQLDVINGDGNVICFGPNSIDPTCLQGTTIGLKFDLKAITNPHAFNKNPSIFFKQMDFGYYDTDIKTIALKSKKLRFRYLYNHGNILFVTLNFLNDENKVLFYAHVHRYSFISYNLPHMHAILSLNFFRFLDALKNSDGTSAHSEINSIYDEISSLSDAELKILLKSLGQALSTTAEFNFYAAHKIDLDALTTIAFYKSKDKLCSVKIKDLATQLADGDHSTVDRLKKLAPSIFHSKRFIEHFIFKTK